MLGTIVNTTCIIAGSIVGSQLRKGIKAEYQQCLYTAMGICSLALGLNACCKYIPQSEYPVLFIVSLALGSLIGTVLQLTHRFDKLVYSSKRLRKKDRKNAVKAVGSTGSFRIQASEENESGNSAAEVPVSAVADAVSSETNWEDGIEEVKENRLSEGLSTGILLYCIGTFSMLGPVLSALNGDNTYLFTNATLDLVTSAVLASTYGIGMVWAAPVLFCWQGAFYLVAKLSEDAISESLLCELSIVGGALITASGLAILRIKDCKTLNMIPSIFIPILFFIIKSFF